MSTHLEVVDHEADYKALRQPPVIINDFKTTSIEDKTFIKDLIYSKYEGDVLSSIPRCNCPSSASPIVGADREGEVCPRCRSKVSARFGEQLESLLWVRAPAGVDAFFNLRVWYAIKNALGNRRVNILYWLTNTSYKLKPNFNPDLLNRIEAAGIKRGLNNFIRNFWKYMDILSKMNDFKKKPAIHDLMIFLAANADRIFTKYLPITNRNLFVIEPTNVEKTYMDLNGIGAIDAIAIMTSIDVPGCGVAQHARENRTAKFMQNMTVYQEHYLRHNIARKSGNYRKHNVSSRMGPSFRAVITSITEPHDFEKIIVPWSTAMVILQPHMENIMLKNGLAPKAILEIFNKYMNRFDQRLYDMMMKILYDYSEKGLPTLWNRNPTLGRSSILMMYIGDIKRDVNDPTVSMSIGIVTLFNADFDGDEMNGAPLYDRYLARAFETFRAHNCVLDINRVKTISGYMGMSKTCVGNGMNWMHEQPTIQENPLAEAYLA